MMAQISDDHTKLLNPTQTRMRVSAAMELAADSADAEHERAGFMTAVPLTGDVRFALALGADGERRRWSASATADAFVKGLSAWFRDSGIEADERVVMLRFGQEQALTRIGAWLEEHDGHVTAGWSVRDVAFTAATALLPAAAARLLGVWARDAGDVVRELTRRVGGSGETELVLDASIASARRAFDTFELGWPIDELQQTFGLFPPDDVALRVVCGPSGVVRLGILALAPRRELVLAASDLVTSDDASDARLAAYEATLAAEHPDALEVSVGDGGLRVAVHLSAR